jgi:hypothetical protein
MRLCCSVGCTQFCVTTCIAIVQYLPYHQGILSPAQCAYMLCSQLVLCMHVVWSQVLCSLYGYNVLSCMAITEADFETCNAMVRSILTTRMCMLQLLAE